tara:strand:- start:251 stop:832 length:582 start_codon:yes stop_codon:yes gene_type:complete
MSVGVYRKRFTYQQRKRLPVPLYLVSATASLYLDPDGNGTAQEWFPFDYTNVDDGARNPTPLPGVDDCYSSTEDEVVEWTVPNISAQTGTTSVVYIWIYTSQTEPKSANLKWDGVWQTAETTWTSPNLNDWNRYGWTIVDDLAPGITDIQIRITSGPGGDDSVDAAYIEVIYTSTSSGSPGSPWYQNAQQRKM